MFFEAKMGGGVRAKKTGEGVKVKEKGEGEWVRGLV